MRFNHLKVSLRTAILVTTVFLLGAGLAVAQQTINLTAARTNTTLPDGSFLPMWGYSCGTAVTGSTATCAALNPHAPAVAPVVSPATPGWSPVLITVPTGQSLTINLTNNLSVPTSLTIVGELGGGLGTSATSDSSPNHSNAQSQTTWPIAGTAGNPGTPPVQGPRVRSFATEVASGGGNQSLTWASLNPGTYLIESGTHPSIQGPMGLYGILVVTTAPVGTTAGTAYPAAGAIPAVTYNAEVPVLFSEIDPVQNIAVDTAVATTGFSETTVWTGGPNGCGAHFTCYPPTVNYTPLYYMINGVAFDRSHASTSLIPASPATGVTGSVLVRFVNAGLRMHVPAIVGTLTGTPAVGGFGLIAEDGNRLPGVTRVQSEVFLAAGKTYDVMVNVPAAGGTALPVFDRELSLSGNATSRDAGMLAYLSVNGAALPGAGAFTTAVARADTYNSLGCTPTTPPAPCPAFTVSDPAKGLIANDTNVFGVTLLTQATNGTVALNRDGTFTYIPTGTAASDSFTYCANGTVIPPAGPGGGPCSSGISTTVTLGAATLEAASGIFVNNMTYHSNVATFLKIGSPGVLSVDTDAAGYPLKVAASSVTASAGLTLSVDPNGGFVASVPSAGTYSFTYKAQNSQGTVSASTATVTLVFPTGSGLRVSVVDGQTKAPIANNDYRWIIEEDRTFYVDPKCTTNPPPTGCPGSTGGLVQTFGTNFHTSYMPVVATGCVGPAGAVACETGQTLLGQPAVCDIGNGVCRTTASQQTPIDPSQVYLDPTKRYYISVLPGDAAIPFQTANASPGHGMGGAPIGYGQLAVTILTQPTPFPPAKLSVFVFEDDFPLNGEQDAGGGVDALSPNEPGLGQFNITIMDDAGGSGDATGQVDYDMFNQPLSNSLAGTIDPATGFDACPIGKTSRIGANDPTQLGITGTIVTCPKYEADGVTLSPLAGSAVVANMMPGRYGVIATPGADRIARGEEWLQTNTLDGQKAHDSFLRIGEAGYFQEYGPAGYHVSIGFANPAIINSRLAGVCATPVDTTLPVNGVDCHNTVKGIVTTERMSRTPDERLYSSGDNSSFSFTQCYVSFGDPDGEDFAFTKCAADGSFSLSGLPDGDWRLTVFDQWNDMLVDGLSTPVRLAGGATTDMGQIAINQWQANFSTRTFFDLNGNGISDNDAAGNPEPGLALVKTNVRYRDGSFSNRNNTDLNGYAAFNEEFPLFNWYVIETDVTRYKNTGTHVVYDAGGPADGNCSGAGAAPCGNSAIGHFKANTHEAIPLPSNLRVPGSFYCATADCLDAPSPLAPGGAGGSTGRVDGPWVLTEGWQGFSGQNNFLEFGKKPYAVGENGGIRGHVIYSSTRPFDDPQFGTQNVWEPLVPGVTINLYREGTAADGVTPTLTLVDTTKTSSWDDWAQGFRSDGMPNMNCPGQLLAPTGTTAGDLFFFTIYNQPSWLDVYNNAHNATPLHTVPYNSQYKCYDGMHNWNQLQPAPYDGMYQFPSKTGTNPVTGNTTGTNCTICVKNPDPTDPFRFGKEDMLPKGKYVVEVVVPPGYELVKEEDKNILIGDNFIAPVTVQFPGLGSAIYILPDQAAVSSTYNANSTQNPTQSLGRSQTLTSHEGDTPTVDTFWPCVGAKRVVPDYISLFPQSLEVAPFAGATRNLCDRKEVTLDDQTSSQAEFFIFTSTHAAAHFTGVITDDFTSEFDPFSPQFGEKFAPPNLPISIKDWTGNEISRVYSDQWGAYNGLTYSTWEVNPPNPTGYSPTMMVTCMNDPGTGATPDPLFNPGYSQFCYEIPFMPGQTQYMDTPVTPTSAFSDGYNHVDCAYPTLTPAVKEVDGDGIGPWVSAAGKTLTITALGDQAVINNGYSGPSAATAPYNQKTVTRHYGFGATAGKVALVGSDGVSHLLTGVSWSDTTITGTVPTGVPNCAMQQQAQYGGSTAQCGELVITSATGQQSIDTVTVTIGGKTPTRLNAATYIPGSQTGPGSIQQAIDAAKPGDMIIVPAGNYNEMLLMWKPLRLQGVGAASSILNATTHPEGKLQPWRRQVNCLFGLSLNGTPNTGSNPYDPTGAYTCGADGSTPWFGYNPTPTAPQVDRLPLEAVVGWDASLNGNLAELLQEPTLMGAYEGAGITVLSKGVDFHNGQPFASDTFPTGTTLLTTRNCGTTAGPNPFPSSFQCNPSSIDGMGVTSSSQGGGGIFVHAWGHNIQIANNRIYNNTGTLSGGISVGQGEFPPGYLQGSTTNADPGSCEAGGPVNTQLPYCHDLNVNIHHNAVMLNSSIGDELFSSTLAGVGGVSFCTGSDYYKFNYNWVCGNVGSGDGGGVGQIGFSKNGDIEHNSILFNQSTNPTISTNGGGLLIMGAPDTDPVCAGGADADCPPGLSDGAGPGLVINANLIMGNAADSGSGGGLRLQGINGTEVTSFPRTPANWYSINITNNIIANNVAGWDGGGVSLQDALSVNFINNTVMSNDTTASAGPLFNTLGAPLASAQGTNCVQPGGTTRSCPQPAGLVSIQNSSPLTTAFGGVGQVRCPAGHPNCTKVSYPLLANNVFWQNRSFYIAVGNLGAGVLSQQNVVALYNSFTTTQALSQTATGACPTANYWDIGVRGDTGPSNHSSTVTLSPTYSILTDVSDYSAASSHNSGSNPAVVSQYCNGSRVPPEFGGMGYQVPPGISDATVPNPVFNLTPAATVDEGNNWINISWGPLSLLNASSSTATNNVVLGNYAIKSGSPAIGYIPSALNGGTNPNYTEAPSTDFFGNLRKTNNAVDAGAVEFQGGAIAVPTLTSVTPNSGLRGTNVNVTLTGTNLTGASAVTVSGTLVTVSNIVVVNSTTVTATFTITSAAAATARNVSVSTPGGTTNNVTFTVTAPPAPHLTSIAPTSGTHGTSVPVTITGTNLTGTTAVTVPGGVGAARVTVTNIVVVNSTTVTAVFHIPTTAPVTARAVTVTTPSGPSNAVTFTVN